MNDAAAAQKRLMESNGLFRSQISPSFTYDNAYQQINIHFDVTSGPRARFTTPVLLGDVKLPEHLILRATKFRRWMIHTWKPMTQSRMNQALDGVRSLYQKEDRLEARVALESVKYDEQANTAQPTLQIDAGPKILVNTIGAKISKSKLQHYVPIFEEHSVDDDLLLEGAHNLRDYLQSQGYFEAEVDVQAAARGKRSGDHRLHRQHRRPAQTGSGTDQRQQILQHGSDSRAHVSAEGFVPAISPRTL